jgi:hypothetical protein
LVLAAVLDDRHLELAREQHDRQTRQEAQGEPGGVASYGGLEQRLDVSGLLRALEDIAEAGMETEGHKETH